MKVIVTGASGFLGARLADWLLSEACPPALRPDLLLLTDTVSPAAASRDDPRVRTFVVDLSRPDAARDLLDSAGVSGGDVLFHLAAVVSGQAEVDFELGMRVNLEATRALLEAARVLHLGTLRFVFASTVGVFGGELPSSVDERTTPAPETSYGAAKACAELLVAEYSRRGFVDGRSVRLPTVTVREGAPNAAVTSFASGAVREPVRGVTSVVPVPADRELWVCSPGAAVRNLARAALLEAGDVLGARRVLNLPGLRVSVRDMQVALRAVCGADVAARMHICPDKAVDRIVATFPVQFDNSMALLLGFEVNSSFEDIIREYLDQTRK